MTDYMYDPLDKKVSVSFKHERNFRNNRFSAKFIPQNYCFRIGVIT